MFSIKPQSGWDNPTGPSTVQQTYQPVRYAYRLDDHSANSSLVGKILKVLILLSIVVGLIGPTIRSGSEVSYPVQALVDAAICFFVLLVAVGILFLYFLPTYKAAQNRKRLTGIIGVLNFFFGWTLIGWWLLLAWGSTPESQDWQAVRTR